MASPLKAISRLFAEAKADVGDLRGRLFDLKAERQRVAEMPRDRAAVAALIDAEIASARADEPFSLWSFWAANNRPSEAADQLKARLLADPFQVLAAWDGDKLKSLILASAPEGISDAQRASEIAKLDRDILLTGIAEEIACRELDAEIGRRFPRRRDADPAILFAPLHELEKGAR